MNSSPLSAVDTFTPAFERMKHLLFKPFRFGVWWRLAILGFLTGEMSSGFNLHLPGNFNFPSHGRATESFAARPPFHVPSIPHLFAWIALAAVIAVVVLLILMYVGSVLRFVLFDAVLTGNVRLREGWRRWRQRGIAFFPWQIGFTIVTLTTYAVILGVPILAAWRAGVFRNPAQHLLILIIGGVMLGAIGFAVVLAGIAIYVLTKDFVVPIMAFEGVGPIDGWRRLKPMLGANKGSYAGYLGFKAVLAIASAVILTIAIIIVLLIILVPVIIVAVVLGVVSAGGGTGLSAAAITLLVIGGIAVGLLVLCIAALFHVPFVAFFQSYALHFFGTRYEPLGAVMYPGTPPQAPPMGMSPSPQPAT